MLIIRQRAYGLRQRKRKGPSRRKLISTLVDVGNYLRGIVDVVTPTQGPNWPRRYLTRVELRLKELGHWDYQ